LPDGLRQEEQLLLGFSPARLRGAIALLDVITVERIVRVVALAAGAIDAHPEQVFLSALLQPEDDPDGHPRAVEGSDALVEAVVEHLCRPVCLGQGAGKDLGA
jgi:hypothetical protein